MNLLEGISPWDSETYGNNITTLRVLIECEKGSINKYEYCEKLGVMTIVRQLHPKYRYPYAYGVVPQTLASDGDGLDAIIITDDPIRSGTIVNCYPLGIVKMIDNGMQDDKLICTPFYNPHGVVDLKKIFKYLKNYKFPNNSMTQLLGFEGVEKAIEEIIEAHDVWKRRSK